MKSTPNKVNRILAAQGDPLADEISLDTVELKENNNIDSERKNIYDVNTMLDPLSPTPAILTVRENPEEQENPVALVEDA